MTNQFHLATSNVAQMRAPIDDPIMKGFVDRLDPLNAIADGSPGFVWRLQEEEGNATSIQVFDDPLILFNLSVWESPELLLDYVYKSNHVEAVQKRSEWFTRPHKSPFTLWWIEAGHLPSVEEAKERLEHLWEHGPTATAFTFSSLYGPDGEKR